MSESAIFVRSGLRGDTGGSGVALTRSQFVAYMQRQGQPAAAPERFGVLTETPEDAKDLAKVGWCIVFPADESTLPFPIAAIQARLEPLLQLRQTQAGERFRMLPDGRAGADSQGYVAGETALHFRQSRFGGSFGIVDPDTAPYYVLLVGNPSAIPFDFQTDLDAQHAVGRLDFEALEDFERYAQAVTAAEAARQQAGWDEAGAAGSAVRPTAAFFAPANDDETRLSRDALVRPLLDKLTEQAHWEAHGFLGNAANRDALDSLLGVTTPALLFAATHGVEFPPGDNRRRSQHGALACDWDGVNKQIARAGYFAGEDLQRPVPNLIAFLFACFSGGIDREDDNSPAQPPFTAALPQQLLRQGALAVVAHVQRAWSFSFKSHDVPGSQTAVYQQWLNSLYAGYPVGHALDSFGARMTDISGVLLEAWKRGDVGSDQFINWWTTYHDARGYLLLGDPAVRLTPTPAANFAAAAAAAPEPIAAQAEAAAPASYGGLGAPAGVPPIPPGNPGDAGAPGTAGAAGSDVEALLQLMRSTNAQMNLLIELLARQPGGTGGAPLGPDAEAYGLNLGEAFDKAKDVLGSLSANIQQQLQDVVDTVRELTVTTQYGGVEYKTVISATGDTKTIIPDGPIDPDLARLHLETVAKRAAGRGELLATLIARLVRGGL